LAAWAVPGRHFIAVPRGRAVMVDGKISSSEWTDANRIDLFMEQSGVVFFSTPYRETLLRNSLYVSACRTPTSSGMGI